MYSTCLHCTRSLGANEVIETLPIGRRLAFDADKGRLWVVCRHCAKWNLVPFDTRLESIDACERLYRDTATRYATDNIGLAKHREGLELIRIGAPLRPEFAAWRYGEGFARRRITGFAIAGLGAAAYIGLTVWTKAGTTGLLSAIGGSAFAVYQSGMFLRLGKRSLQRLPLRHPESGKRITLKEDFLRRSEFRTTAEGHYGVRLWWGETPFDHHGDEARMLTARLLAKLNRFDGSRRGVAEATRYLADRGDWDTLVRGLTREPRAPLPEMQRPPAPTAAHAWQGLPFGDLAPDVRLAMEMATHEESERRWLEGELALLEREWREAEKLARIADDLAASHEP